jgi:hypothetical protein
MNGIIRLRFADESQTPEKTHTQTMSSVRIASVRRPSAGVSHRYHTDRGVQARGPGTRPISARVRIRSGFAPPVTPAVGVSASSSDDPDGSVEDGVYRVDLNDLEGASRRSMLVSFTCNACGGRTERLVNPLAWAKGMVIVQCEQCKAWHKVADSQNMVEEYRFGDNSDDE